MRLTRMASAALVLCASIAWAKPPREATEVTVVVVSGGSSCPTGTTELYAGSSVVFRNPNSGNLTEDARCWQTPPSSTTQVDVLILSSCVVCRFGP